MIKRFNARTTAVYAGVISLLATQASAGTPVGYSYGYVVDIPEVGGVGAVVALTAVVGSALILRERRQRRDR